MVKNHNGTGSEPHTRPVAAHNDSRRRSRPCARIGTYSRSKTFGKSVLLVAVVLVMSFASYTQSYASSLDAGGDIERRESPPTSEEWRSAVLASLREGGSAMQHAAEYIIANDVQIRFRSLGEGAMWWLDGNIYMNAERYPPQTRPDHPGILALIVHEAKHLEQGPLVALSVYGELEAWQIQYHVFKELIGTPPGTYEKRMAWDELSQIPLSYSRDDLNRARRLIQFIGGANYPIDRLPLLPLSAEIARSPE
jgi:hypothetical protein